NRNWKSFALAIVGAEYILRWLPRGTHQWDKFVTPDELVRHLANNKLAITDQAGVIYHPFADRWSLSSAMDVNCMVVAGGVELLLSLVSEGRHGLFVKPQSCHDAVPVDRNSRARHGGRD